MLPLHSGNLCPGRDFFLLVECITFGKELMAICKRGDGWKFCYTCCNKNGLLGYQMQEWKPKLQPPLGLLTQDSTCISIFWAIPKDLCFLVKWVPFEMLVFGYRDSVLGVPGFLSEKTGLIHRYLFFGTPHFHPANKRKFTIYSWR